MDKVYLDIEFCNLTFLLLNKDPYTFFVSNNGMIATARIKVILTICLHSVYTNQKKLKPDAIISTGLY